MDEVQVLKINLELFLKAMKTKPNCYDFLESIFEMQFKYADKKQIFPNLSSHIGKTFNENPYLLFNYLKSDFDFKIDELNLNKDKFRKALAIVNKLKLKYGFIIGDLMLEHNNPFMFKSIEVGVSQNDSMHPLKVLRADNVYFECEVKADALLGAMTSLSTALEKMIKDGIYNFNINSIKMHLKQSEDLNKTLNALINPVLEKE